MKDRLPPHSTEAEQGVLGCCLIAPNESIGICLETFKRGGEVFYDLRHQTIYETLVEMYDAKLPVDIITVQQRLKDKGQLEVVGGIAVLSAFQDAVPSAANLTFYADIVREKYALRRALKVCAETGEMIQSDETRTASEILDVAERDILAVRDSLSSAEGLPDIKELVRQSLDDMERFHAAQGKPTGILSGLYDLDRLTFGFQPGEMIVLAARPSCGKTSLGIQIAERVAVEDRIPVGIFSLEMTGKALVMRMKCSRARVNIRDIQRGEFCERDFPKISEAAAKIAASPLHIDDTPGLSILQLRAKARRMWQQHGIKLLVIDYLQLLNAPKRGRSDHNRQQEVSDISAGVKALAKELNIPIIVLAQLNRELEKDKSRKPRLSDLRESGAIEQDADVVMMLWKPVGRDDEGEPSGDCEPVNLLVAKQRNGPTGGVNLIFQKQFTRFESAARISHD